MSAFFDRFSLDKECGFLPASTPCEPLQGPYEQWEALGLSLPTLLSSKKLRSAIDQLPILPHAHIEDQERAMLVLSFLAHAYLREGGSMTDRLPAAIAVPWVGVAESLGRLPVLAHPTLILQNWQKIDPNGSMEPENLQALFQFTESDDENWFYVITVAIEALGAQVLPLLIAFHEAPNQASAQALLNQMTMSLEQMRTCLLRMGEACDPEVFFHQLRPYIGSLIEVRYEGLNPDRVLNFAGGSAAQSSLLQAFDAIICRKQLPGQHGSFLKKMRAYMPPAHRAFLRQLEQGPSLSDLTRQDKSLHHAFSACANALAQFRTAHLQIVSRYIAGPSRRAGVAATGTGGTEALSFLKAIRNHNHLPAAKDPS